ncbi:hypothetical protein WJX81_005302 [Elliptochloris bilobata]|uniref:Adaptor protein ClpS core domain-containing protein n=1 Tax=Elliptochloris bilobata TaxID=381761 RepID=A0AAW1S2I1_9CHLO
MVPARVGLRCSTASPANAPAGSRLAAPGVVAGLGLTWHAATLWPSYLARREGVSLRGVRRDVIRAAGPGGGVLDRPTISVPGLDIGKETQRQRPRFYRVMLHNDNFNRREYVVQVLLKIIPGMTVDDAVNVMQEAHVNGLACVIACAQQEAEEYCERLRLNGLMVTLEPSGSGGSGSPDAC